MTIQCVSWGICLWCVLQPSDVCEWNVFSAQSTGTCRQHGAVCLWMKCVFGSIYRHSWTLHTVVCLGMMCVFCPVCRHSWTTCHRMCGFCPVFRRSWMMCVFCPVYRHLWMVCCSMCEWSVFCPVYRHLWMVCCSMCEWSVFSALSTGTCGWCAAVCVNEVCFLPCLQALVDGVLQYVWMKCVFCPVCRPLWTVCCSMCEWCVFSALSAGLCGQCAAVCVNDVCFLPCLQALTDSTHYRRLRPCSGPYVDMSRLLPQPPPPHAPPPLPATRPALDAATTVSVTITL